MSKAESTQEAALSFESGLDALDSLITRLESGRLPLEEALDTYRRGATLLQACQKQLSSAEAQMQVLEGDILKAFHVDSVEETKQVPK